MGEKEQRKKPPLCRKRVKGGLTDSGQSEKREQREMESEARQDIDIH